ncbi:peroxiredoxin [Citrobacter freundii]|nr:peroxiredoxin [Citrobacter freundii]QDE43659.1 peroxiredoxin [Citrobacter sp. CF971]QFX90924.1 peroxiredoxin [Citrobacter sp. S39]TKU53737.1 peroxiredoxin [Citrobacter sp. wls712]MBE0048698.1 peroxiredoxin [Citrobacter freundii]
MLDKENAAKRERAQANCGSENKKCNGHCGLVKKDYRIDVFIDESTVLWRFY